LLRAIARTLLPAPFRHELALRYVEWRVRSSPDRVFLRQEIIPAVARQCRRVLFVGCRPYTAKYPTAFASLGSECWTVDIDPTVARWGAPGRHRVADVRALGSLFPPDNFDGVILSGVFGFGVDADDMKNETLVSCAAVLRPGGLFVLGWNTDRGPDPGDLEQLALFEQTSLEQFAWPTRFTGSTHVFQFYRKRA
jgi:SAM-dependent methyltransferase